MTPPPDMRYLSYRSRLRGGVRGVYLIEGPLGVL